MARACPVTISPASEILGDLHGPGGSAQFGMVCAGTPGMRQLMVSLPPGAGERAISIVESYDAKNVHLLARRKEEGELLVAHVPNRQVEPVLDELESLGEIEITLNPRGIIALYPPVEEAPDQVVDVQMRSPLEIFLAALQSIGSWKGYLAYAAAGGLIVWVGFFKNAEYLLIAAMLISPFAGPAMNLAIGTARGDLLLIRRSLLRYVAGLSTALVVAALMTLLLDQRVATALMVELSQVSTVAVILPLVAGAAGAVNLLESERSSLVSGAAVGMLVAASLAPPVGMVGMAIAMTEWTMVKSGLFLLSLQLVGINVAGAIVFRLAGLSTRGARYDRGRRWIGVLSFIVSAVVLVALVVFQFWRPPTLTRSTDAQRANAEIHAAVRSTGIADLVESNVRFTRANVKGQNSLLCVLYVQPIGKSFSDAEVRRAVETAVFERLDRENVTPLLNIQVVRGRQMTP